MNVFISSMEIERINRRKRASAGYALSLLRGLMNRLVPPRRYIVASKVTPVQLRCTIGGMYAIVVRQSYCRRKVESRTCLQVLPVFTLIGRETHGHTRDSRACLRKVDHSE